MAYQVTTFTIRFDKELGLFEVINDKTGKAHRAFATMSEAAACKAAMDDNEALVAEALCNSPYRYAQH